MMFKKNDVVEINGETVRRVRILWLSEQQDQAVGIDIDSTLAMPDMMDLPTLLDAIQAQDVRLLEPTVGMSLVSENSLNEKYKQIRDKAWSIIETLVVDEPGIYSASYRGKQIRRVVEIARSGSDVAKQKLTSKLVYGYLRRYWQRGMVKNALLPDYANSGGPGKTKSAGEKKRGRPTKYGSSKGINVDEKIRQIFSVGFQRYYASDRKKGWTLRDAYNKTIEDFFCEKIIDPETGDVTHAPTKEFDVEGELPSYDQFQYWSDKDHNRLETKRVRIGSRIYDKDLRGLTGTSNAEVMGPGDRYQIDATIADVYLVSRINRKRIVGRPVIYVVIDVFSRMIVGLYIGFEGPSWVGAMMALANAAGDKVAYCGEHGIEIAFEDWPCMYLPGTVLGDRGEIEGAIIETLANNFNVIIENSAPYRADWKGIVERRFRLLPAKFKPFVPGYIQQDFRARGGKDYRLDAVLDLEDFTQIIIKCVLHYNNNHEISKYDKDRDVFADGVPPIPIELWDWGRQHRTGAMRSFDEELVKYSLLPREMAKVTEYGIRFRNQFYTSPLAMNERWFDQARQGKRWSIEVSFDPRCLDQVYLDVPGSQLRFDVCSLTDRSRAARGVSLAEFQQQEEADKHNKADRRRAKTLSEVNLAADIEMGAAAAKEKTGGTPSGSDASRTKDIRANRDEEKQANREGEVFQLGRPDSDHSERRAEVVQFPAKPGVDDDIDYSLPSLEEILGDNHD